MCVDFVSGFLFTGSNSERAQEASKKVNEGMLGIFLRGECLGPGTAGLMDEG